MKADEVYAILKRRIESISRTQVTGVKGEAEEEFRSEQVSISKENIGLGNVENVAVDDMVPTIEETDERENISDGDKLPALFGKIKKWFSDLKPIAFTADYANLTGAPDSLKNPEKLTIKFNGTAQEDYDGSEAKEYDITPSAIGAAESEHTHLYAGSDSEGGSASSAAKLDVSDVGSDTKPVYFAGGKPVECVHELNESVPEGAVFTDTTYEALKNPEALTFTGSADDVYDGSEAKTVNIPAAVSVKGDTEETYRTGEVNITKDNIGLDKVENTADSEKHVAVAASADKVAHALTFTGDIEETVYDGSEEKTVTISKEALGLEKVENKTAEEILQGMTGEKIAAALGYKPIAPLKRIEKTLEAGSWQGDQFPYTYTIEISEVQTETQLVYVHGPEKPTMEQIEAFSSACITGDHQETGKIVLQAVEKPATNLPIVIEIGGELYEES